MLNASSRVIGAPLLILLSKCHLDTKASLGSRQRYTTLQPTVEMAGGAGGVVMEGMRAKETGHGGVLEGGTADMAQGYPDLHLLLLETRSSAAAATMSGMSRGVNVTEEGRT